MALTINDSTPPGPWKTTFFILGVLWFIEAGTKSIVEEQTNAAGIGVVNLAVAYLTNALFGYEFAGMFAGLLSVVLPISGLWLIVMGIRMGWRMLAAKTAGQKVVR